MRRAPSPPPPPPPSSTDRSAPAARGDWHTVRTLLPYLLAYKGRVALALSCLIAAKVANVGVPLVLKQIVDSPETGYARFETAGGVTFSVQIDPEEKIIATSAIYLECDDLDERVEKLARSGIAFEHGPRNQPWMWREARLRDPDGNIIFFYKAGESRRFPPWRMSS